MTQYNTIIDSLAIDLVCLPSVLRFPRHLECDAGLHRYDDKGAANCLHLKLLTLRLAVESSLLPHTSNRGLPASSNSNCLSAYWYGVSMGSLRSGQLNLRHGNIRANVTLSYLQQVHLLPLSTNDSAGTQCSPSLPHHLAGLVRCPIGSAAAAAAFLH